MEIGFDLRAARATQGLSQAELAQASGLSVRQIKALEAGSSKDPHPDTVRRLRAALPLAFPHLSALDAHVAEEASLLHTIASDLRAVAPSLRYLELRYEQTGRTSFTYYASEAYDEAGQPITASPFDALWEAFNEHSTDYLNLFGYHDDSCCLDLIAESTLMPWEFSDRVFPESATPAP